MLFNQNAEGRFSAIAASFNPAVNRTLNVEGLLFGLPTDCNVSYCVEKLPPNLKL